MQDWNIRNQLQSLTLLPTIIIIILLVSVFTYSRLQGITISHEKKGKDLAELASSISQTKFSHDAIDEIQPVLRNLLNDKDLYAIKIMSNDGHVIIYLQNFNVYKTPHYLDIFVQDHLDNYKAEIGDVYGYYKLDDTKKSKTGTLNGREYDFKGEVVITLSSRHYQLEKLETVLINTLIGLTLITIYMIIYSRLDKLFFEPVKRIKNTLNSLANNKYETIKNTTAKGDLKNIIDNINILSESLKLSKDKMEERINEYTRELEETLEELEIRNVELDITRSNAMQASNAKSEFLANMSHEIRTPLSGIIGFSELLQKTELKKQQKDYAITIHKSAVSLLNTIDDVLDLSKIESGKLDITQTSVNITDIVEDIIDLLAPIAYDKDVELLYNIDRRVPESINVDLIRIKQILTNLVGNAVKFTEKGYVHLNIELEESPNRELSLKFVVSDTGIGMNKQHKKAIFDAFSQADNSITRKFGGTGLGLTISRNLALLMGGTIGFDSTYGEGSTFWLILPIINFETLDKTPDSHLRNKNILLIDDKKLYQKSTLSMLESWGCNVLTCSKKTLLDNPGIISDNAIDIQLVNIYRSDLLEKKLAHFRPDNTLAPSIAIVSTRSHIDLGQIKQIGYIDSLSRTSKSSVIKETLLSVLAIGEHNKEQNNPDTSYEFDKFLQDVNVLIVDDNDVNLRLAEILIKDQGANVTTASSGEESIKKVKARYFELIFMDLHMPGIDGLAASKNIRELPLGKDSIIIALTANAMNKNKQRMFENGINDLVIKPINQQVLIDISQIWLNGKTATHDNVPFSREEAIELASGNEQLAGELLTMLINDLNDFKNEIKNAFLKNNVKQLRSSTHKLHGASRCCGTPALRYAASQLESVIDNNISGKIEEGVNLLLVEIDRLQNIKTEELGFNQVD